MNTRITVVTITFNAAHCLERTLQSVLSQCHPYVEHLIIDGRSTDDTLALARRYQADSRQLAATHEVVITSEPDRGIYDAMNKGLGRATGRYVVFLNAGDTFASPSTLEQVAALAADDVAVIYGDTDITDDQGRYLHPRRLRPPRRLSWRSFRQGMLVCHQAFYARTDIARRVPYDLHYRYSADVDWCIRVMREAEQQGLRLCNAGATLACYTEQGATTRHHRASLRERFRVMARHYGLPVTLAMHAWFVLRAVGQKLRRP